MKVKLKLKGENFFNCTLFIHSFNSSLHDHLLSIHHVVHPVLVIGDIEKISHALSPQGAHSCKKERLGVMGATIEVCRKLSGGAKE